jgi:hypothetical protein
MDMTGSLEDPRRRQGEALAFEAERARKAGDEARAIALFAQAAELDEEVAQEAPASEPRARSVLAISAVALWLDAHRREEAARTACAFLARPEMLTEQGKADLEELLERAFHERGPAKAVRGRVEVEGS